MRISIDRRGMDYSGPLLMLHRFNAVRGSPAFRCISSHENDGLVTNSLLWNALCRDAVVVTILAKFFYQKLENLFGHEVEISTLAASISKYYYYERTPKKSLGAI